MSPRSQRVGIKDVATAAGVSIATVSHAINGKGRVDEKTRRRVVEVAQELGYRPNVNAINLLQGRSTTLALTVSSPSSSPFGLFDVEFFVRLANAATAAALDAGYALVITPYRGAETFDGVAIDGGIVIDPEAHDPLLTVLEKRGIPVVTSGRDLGRPSVPSLDNDHERGAHQVLDHLAARGARRIALVTTSPRYSYGADMRVAYERWCAARGMEPLIGETGQQLTETAGYEIAVDLLRRETPPDAIFTAFDCHASGACLAARELGLAIPEQLLVASGSDSDRTRASSPPVTALDLHPDRSGRQLVEVLIRWIDGGAPPTRSMTLPVDLIERASTARPAVVTGAGPAALPA